MNINAAKHTTTYCRYSYFYMDNFPYHFNFGHFVVVVSAGSGINDPPLCVFSLFKIIILREILRRRNKNGAHHFLCRIKNNPPTPCKTASFRQLCSEGKAVKVLKAPLATSQ